MVSCNMIPLNLTALFLYWCHSINLHCVCTLCRRNYDSIYNLGKRSMCFLMTNQEKNQPSALPEMGKEGYVILCCPCPLTTNKLKKWKVSRINCNVGNRKCLTIWILFPPTNLTMKSDLWGYQLWAEQQSVWEIQEVVQT